MRAFFVFLVLGLGLCGSRVWAKPGASARARPRVHRVAKGHTLGKISARYGVSVAAICYANKWNRHKRLPIGTRLYIPAKSDPQGKATRRYRDEERAESTGRGKAVARKEKQPADSLKSPSRSQDEKKAKPSQHRWHRVYKGQRLGTIARRYRVRLAALRHANNLDSRARIRPGQKLIVPKRDDKDGAQARVVFFKKLGKKDLGSTSDTKRNQTSNASYTRYLRRTARQGFLVINGRRSKWRGQLVDKKGRLLKRGRREMSRVMATSDGKTIEVHPRLLKLLAVVSDAFGGRRLLLVSGYRLGSTSKTSRHRQGRAIDFRIEGVPAKALRDFVKTFEKVGVGYYPKSQFVHLDVRAQWTYWIDYSGTGQKARYGGFWVKRGGREVAVKPR